MLTHAVTVWVGRSVPGLVGRNRAWTHIRSQKGFNLLELPSKFLLPPLGNCQARKVYAPGHAVESEKKENPLEDFVGKINE